MHVLMVHPTAHIPVTTYGGTERVLWALGKELARMGHRVTYLVREGSCPFAQVIAWDGERTLAEQMPGDVDVLHFHADPPEGESLRKPYVFTFQSAGRSRSTLDRNTIFVSRSHARRFASDCFIHNGLDWDDYGSPDLGRERTYVHFLGDAAWRVKNVRGAIRIARAAGETLYVLGGRRINFRMGFRLTLSPHVKFFGWVGGEEKLKLIGGSKGLVFPVRWHEPFGLAIIESLFFGCPVFGTPYGSLPELVPADVGHLSARAADLAEAVRNSGAFDRRRCHDYAVASFNSRVMALAYLSKYEKVLGGEPLNPVPPRQDVKVKGFLPFD